MYLMRQMKTADPSTPLRSAQDDTSMTELWVFDSAQVTTSVTELRVFDAAPGDDICDRIAGLRLCSRWPHLWQGCESSTLLQVTTSVTGLRVFDSAPGDHICDRVRSSALLQDHSFTTEVARKDSL